MKHNTILHFVLKTTTPYPSSISEQERNTIFNKLLLNIYYKPMAQVLPTGHDLFFEQVMTCSLN